VQDLHRAPIMIQPKTHAPLSKAKPVLGRRDALKPTNVTNRLVGITVNTTVNSSSRFWIELAKFSLSDRRPSD
jgi:hypothetical protein